MAFLDVFYEEADSFSEIERRREALRLEIESLRPENLFYREGYEEHEFRLGWSIIPDPRDADSETPRILEVEAVITYPKHGCTLRLYGWTPNNNNEREIGMIHYSDEYPPTIAMLAGGAVADISWESANTPLFISMAEAAVAAYKKSAAEA